MRKTIDMMFGTSLNHHVMGGYEFLMQNCSWSTFCSQTSHWINRIKPDKRGDRICIFGFSRGAYTARALAGMIEKVGLLPAGNHQQVPFAYKMFKNKTRKGWELSQGFKNTFSTEVKIDFMGVWCVLVILFQKIFRFNIAFQGYRLECRAYNTSHPSFHLWQSHRQSLPTCTFARWTPGQVPCQSVAVACLPWT